MTWRTILTTCVLGAGLLVSAHALATTCCE